MKITPDVQTQEALREAWVREQTGHPLPFLAAVARVCIVSKTQELSRQPASADELGGRSTHDRSRLSRTHRKPGMMAAPGRVKRQVWFSLITPVPSQFYTMWFL